MQQFKQVTTYLQVDIFSLIFISSFDKSIIVSQFDNQTIILSFDNSIIEEILKSSTSKLNIINNISD